MLAPLTALLFAAVIWLVAMLGVRTAKESGGKIRAALKGRSPLADKSELVAGAIRFERRPEPLLRTEPRLRAAA